MSNKERLFDTDWHPYKASFAVMCGDVFRLYGNTNFWSQKNNNPYEAMFCELEDNVIYTEVESEFDNKHEDIDGDRSLLSECEFSEEHKEIDLYKIQMSEGVLSSDEDSMDRASDFYIMPIDKPEMMKTLSIIPFPDVRNVNLKRKIDD
ncbi:hypothetical protein ACOME3_006906 [Neoechinorhynchus agilis]